MKKILIWTLIAIVAIVALYFFLRFNQNASTLDAVTLDVSEAFFRYEFEKQKGYNTNAYFLKIKGKDAPPELLTRFKRNSPPVKKGSEVKYDLFDTPNGIEFWIDSYKWYGNIVVIHGGLYVGNTGMETGDYTLIKIINKWIVVSYAPGEWA